MGYYRNASNRPLSVTVNENDAALLPPNYFVKVDPTVERRYSTKRLVSLGLLVRCGRPGASDKCVHVDSALKVEGANSMPSPFAEALTEFAGTTRS